MIQTLDTIKNISLYWF